MVTIGCLKNEIIDLHSLTWMMKRIRLPNLSAKGRGVPD